MAAPSPRTVVLHSVQPLTTRTDPLWSPAAALGRTVAGVLGADGRFATHLEFFETGTGLVVMEVCVRAPGVLRDDVARCARHRWYTIH